MEIIITVISVLILLYICLKPDNENSKPAKPFGEGLLQDEDDYTFWHPEDGD